VREEQHPCGANKQKYDEHDVASLLFLVATVGSFAHCCSAIPITTKWYFDQDVKVVPGTTFTKITCNRCGSLQKRGDVVATSLLALH